MVDGAQANWNDVCIVYGIGDPMVKMVDKKWTYFFHWIKSLDRHTKQLITPKFHDQHKALYYEYKKTRSLEEAELRYAIIWSWWYLFGVINKGAIHKLNNWLDFLHFCVR
jgi:hypothetical protein